MKKRRRYAPVKSGDILREIAEEGAVKGFDWQVPPLFLLRKEQTEENIQRKLKQLEKKVNRMRVRHPAQTYPDPTREEALEYLPFPRYGNIKGLQRRYTRLEARNLKQLIKKVRRYE